MNERLIEYKLGLLGAEERADVERLLAEDADLSARADRLGRMLEPLASWQAPEPPVSMVDDIVRAAETATPLSYIAARTALPPEREPGGRRPILTLREVIALAACIALFIGVIGPGAASTRSRRLQALCADNMAGLYRGLSSYSMENDGNLPTMPTGANWLVQPNRYHLQPAITIKIIQPRDMVCPTSRVAAPDDQTAVSNPGAFLGNARLRFYSIQNLNGPAPRMTIQFTIPPAVVADGNPMFEGGHYRPLSRSEMNSAAHEGRGQNVLFLDGSVKFMKTPIHGPQHDNIWEAEGLNYYTGTETQRSATDAFLIP